jgi:hypothetical protein
MPALGNGQKYQIVFSGYVAQELKTLHHRAKALGSGKAYVESLEHAVFRMEHAPWEYGELVRRVAVPPLSVHVGVTRPLLIEFAIHEARPIVLIKRVELMP